MYYAIRYLESNPTHVCTVRGRSILRAATAVDDHAGQEAVDDVEVGIEVEHGDGGHLAGGAAWPRSTGGAGHVRHVCVRVLLQEHEGTLARAVVGLVLLGRDDPVPPEGLEVHRQRVAAAARLLAVLVAVVAERPFGPELPVVRHVDLEERHLRKTSMVK